MKIPIRAVAAIFSYLLCTSSLLHAQQNVWSSGIGLATSQYDEKLNPVLSGSPVKNMNITSDGSGGIIMCWSSATATGYTVNAQRVTATGKIAWLNTAAGLTIATTGTDQSRMVQCVGDGNGGAYFGWTAIDSRSGLEKQFIQYITPAGQKKWGPTGFILTPANSSAAPVTENANVMQMDNDGAGGVLLAYYTYTNDSHNGTLNVARLAVGFAATPKFVWGPTQVLKRTSGQIFSIGTDPVISNDGYGGAFVAGEVSDADTAFRPCVAYISASGTVVFDNQFAPTTAQIDARLGFQIVGDNTGAMLAYVMMFDPAMTYIDQTVGMRVTTAGAIAWGPKVLHNPTDHYQFYPHMTSDGAGGVYLLLNDSWKSSGMYLQHVDNAGNILLNPGNSPAGVSLDGVGAPYAQVLNDGLGNALCAWSNGGKIELQKYSSAGKPVWKNPFSPANGILPEIITDNQAGAFVGWNGTPSSSVDVFAQHVSNTSTSGTPHMTVANALTFPATAYNLSTYSLPLIISNVGTGDLNLSASSIISGPSAAEFSLSGTPFPATLTPASSDTLWVTFAPRTTAGPRNATLQLISNDSASPTFQINLAGSSIGIPGLISSTYIDAGHIQTGTQDTVTFIIGNASQATAPLVIQSLGIDGVYNHDYKILTPITYPVVLQPGQVINVNVEFTAIQNGPLPAQMRVISNDTTSIQVVPIIGYGLKSQMFASATDAGKVDLEHCKVFLLKVTNEGTADMHLASFLFGGSHPDEFQVVGSANNVVIPPGSSNNIQLQFCPNNPGPQHAVAQLVSSDKDTLLVDLRGWGGNGGALHSTSPVDFGTLSAKQTYTRTIQVVNVSDLPTTITGSSLLGLTTSPFTVDIATPFTLRPGDSLSVPVIFAPNALGTFSDTLTLGSSDLVPLKVALAGKEIQHPFTTKPSALFTDSIAVGMSETAIFELKNLSSMSQVIRNAYLNGPDASAYQVTSLLIAPFTIKPNGIDTITLKFTPRDKSTTRVYRAGLAIVSASGDTINLPFHGTGIVAVTDVAQNAPTPVAYQLEQNYPNPFATSTTVSYALPDAGDAAIVVYDVIGREVGRMSEGYRTAGIHIGTFNGAQLPPGLYTYALRVNGVDRLHMMMRITR